MMKKPIFDEKLPRVTPADFGAVGDGKTNDSAALQAAIDHASQNGCVLELDEVEYYCAEVTVLKNVTVLSNNAKISYHGIHKNMPAVDVWDDVNIFGTLNVWARDNSKESPGDHGGRCGIGFGEYLSGRGAHRCYLQHVILTGGGFLGTNAVFATGDTSDLIIDHITVPAGTNYHRAFLAHWGNAADHYVIWNADGTRDYGHVKDWKYTTHPHDIHLGRVEILGTERNEKYADCDNSAVTLSAVYNVTVDEAIAHNAAHVVHLLPGDIGFEYADPKEQEIGMKNIYVKKAYGTAIRGAGINLTMYIGGYIPGLVSKCGIVIDEAYIEADPEWAKRNRAPGLNAYGLANAKIGTLTLKNYAIQAMNITRASKNMEFGTVNLENCASQAAYIFTTNGYNPPANIHIHTLNIKNCGSEGVPMIHADQLDAGFAVDCLKLENATYAHLAKMSSNAKEVTFKAVNGCPKGLQSVLLATGKLNEANAFELGEHDFGDVPMVMGEAALVRCAKTKRWYAYEKTNS